MGKSIMRVFLKHLLGVIGAIILLFVMHYFANSTNSEFLLGIDTFLRTNFLAIILLFVIEFCADVFKLFGFPVNLLYPVFKASAVTFGVYILSRLFGTGIAAYNPLYAITFMILAVYVMIIVFLFTFVVSLFSLFGKNSPVEKTRKESDLSWKGIGNEIKELLHDFIGKIRKSMKK